MYSPPAPLTAQAPEPRSPARRSPGARLPDQRPRPGTRRPVLRVHPLQCHAHKETLMAETFVTSWCTDSRSRGGFSDP